MTDKKELCIIGFGRLGQTIAPILSDAFTVYVLESDDSKHDAIVVAGCSRIAKADLPRFDTVVLCVPISQFETVIEDIAEPLQPSATVIDTCSVKVFPVETMRKFLPDTVSIVATHPIFGPDSIKAGLSNLNFVLCRVRAEDSIFTFWKDFWTATGVHVIETSPEEHDKVMARTLAMTHYFGRILGALNLRPEPMGNVGYEALYKVMLQTNNDSWQLFYDMQTFNPYAKEMRGEVHTAIHSLDNKLRHQGIDEGI